MNLLYTEVEDDLRGSVRALLTDRSGWSAVLARIESPDPYDTKLWRALAVDLGLAGLVVPEGAGGAGASFREAAVVAEELGRAVAPVPFLGSAVVAAATLLACLDAAMPAGGPASAGVASTEHAAPGGVADLLGQIASGARTAVLAVPFVTYPGAPMPQVRTEEGRLTGTVPGVADALPADVLLIAATDGLYTVDASAPGLTRTPVVSLDMTRQLCDVSLAGVPGRRLAGADAASAGVSAGVTAGAALLASELLGVAEYCLSSTVEYAKTRYQFGRPIGSFQALKHRLADLWVDVTQARAVARYAADCLASHDPDVPVATALAKAHCSEVAVRAAEECVQMHGGIGFTWEHPAHLYLKRAKSGSIAFGTADRHRAALADLVDLPAV